MIVASSMVKRCASRGMNKHLRSLLQRAPIGLIMFLRGAEAVTPFGVLALALVPSAKDKNMLNRQPISGTTPETPISKPVSPAETRVGGYNGNQFPEPLSERAYKYDEGHENDEIHREMLLVDDVDERIEPDQQPDPEAQKAYEKLKKELARKRKTAKRKREKAHRLDLKARGIVEAAEKNEAEAENLIMEMDALDPHCRQATISQVAKICVRAFTEVIGSTVEAGYITGRGSLTDMPYAAQSWKKVALWAHHAIMKEVFHSTKSHGAMIGYEFLGPFYLTFPTVSWVRTSQRKHRPDLTETIDEILSHPQHGAHYVPENGSKLGIEYYEISLPNSVTADAENEGNADHCVE